MLQERQLIIKSLTMECAGHWGDTGADRQNQIIRHIERGCFNAVLESCQIDGEERNFSNPVLRGRYSAATAKVIANIKIVLPRILAGEISPANVNSMTSRDLNPAASAEEYTAIEMRRNSTFERKVSTAHTCRKCQNNKTTKLEGQSRALDEESDISVKCVTCGNVWRV